MEKNRTIAIYVRCSTSDQKTDLQLRELEVYVASRGWTVFKVYEDKATGTNDKRAMYQQMMKDARSRKFDLLLCWKLDRLFRSLKDLLLSLQELTDLGITFVSLKDQIDLGSSAGRLMLHLTG